MPRLRATPQSARSKQRYVGAAKSQAASKSRAKRRRASAATAKKSEARRTQGWKTSGWRTPTLGNRRTPTRRIRG